jgi:hypothetical protein
MFQYYNTLRLERRWVLILDLVYLPLTVLPSYFITACENG